MASPVVLPRQGQSVESCIITSWNKQEGDAVQVGDVLFTYETDKATFEELAKEAGTLLKIFFEADDDVPVLTTVAVIGQPGRMCQPSHPKGRYQPRPKRHRQRKPPRRPYRQPWSQPQPLPSPHRACRPVRAPRRSAWASTWPLLCPRAPMAA